MRYEVKMNNIAFLLQGITLFNQVYNKADM